MPRLAFFKNLILAWLFYAERSIPGCSKILPSNGPIPVEKHHSSAKRPSVDLLVKYCRSPEKLHINDPFHNRKKWAIVRNALNQINMKKTLWMLSGLLISSCIISCKKDDDDNGTTPVADYTPMAVGDYWIYEHYRVDSLGNATPLGTTDSTYIEKDTVINSSVYYKMISPGLPGENRVYLLRDSSHYLVSHTGEILFSSQNFTDTLNEYYIVLQVTAPDTVARVIKKMADRNVDVTTPAGTFTTSNYQAKFLMYPNWSVMGNTRYVNARYAPGVGLVKESLSFFVSSPYTEEKRLLRYHLH
jgi:hypothetical protein